jgi:TDG/mug DNA glycosylase family protein
VLVLGSLPGELSLARRQYYGNPRNQFWRLIGEMIGAPDLADLDYEQRLAALKAAGVGLWDVIRTASRVGSLDTAIRDHQSHQLADFAATLPALRVIAFNGGKASEIGRKQLSDGGPWALITLPSSSPAYTLAFERKREAWMTLRRYLQASG